MEWNFYRFKRTALQVKQTDKIPSDGATRSTAKRDAGKMFLSTGGIRGRARQQTKAGMTLLSLSILARVLCPYSSRMSRVTLSDGSENFFLIFI